MIDTLKTVGVLLAAACTITLFIYTFLKITSDKRAFEEKCALLEKRLQQATVNYQDTNNALREYYDKKNDEQDRIIEQATAQLLNKTNVVMEKMGLFNEVVDNLSTRVEILAKYVEEKKNPDSG